MSIPINTNYDVLVPLPFDGRTQVAVYGDLANIPVVFVGLKTYVVADNVEYRYYSTGWQIWSTQGGGGGTTPAVWGSITGTLANQVDLGLEFNKKFNKTGGIITGAVTVQATVDAYNFILAGSAASSELSPFAKLVSVPVNANDPGVVGEYAVDAQFAYFCIAVNTWVRSVVGTWV